MGKKTPPTVSGLEATGVVASARGGVASHSVGGVFPVVEGVAGDVPAVLRIVVAVGRPAVVAVDGES